MWHPNFCSYCQLHHCDTKIHDKVNKYLPLTFFRRSYKFKHIWVHQINAESLSLTHFQCNIWKWPTFFNVLLMTFVYSKCWAFLFVALKNMPYVLCPVWAPTIFVVSNKAEWACKPLKAVSIRCCGNESVSCKMVFMNIHKRAHGKRSWDNMIWIRETLVHVFQLP